MSVRLASEECGCVAAPVFGRPDRAELAELIVVSAGALSDCKRAGHCGRSLRKPPGRVWYMR
jgi:3-hydroxyisobutyrate dehydrogenase-like beta-hydroxyacid dehydrogenase